MELHQLRYFLAVVDEGSFTAAADAVRISQSGISTQIQKLERELGIALIDRSARRVALTDAGATLVPYARNALAAVSGVTDAAQAIRGLVVGSLRVATVTGLVWPRLFDALAAVHTAHPGIDLRLREGTSADHLAAVRDGTIDIAVAAWAADEPTGVEVALVVDDPLVAVVAPGHPWAGRPRLRPTELARDDLVTLPRGTGARAALDELFARAGRVVEPRWEVATPAYVQMLAGRGLGVGVVSATTAADWDGVAVLPIDDPGARSRLGVVWRSSPGPPARALLAHLVGDAQAS
jgi:DNA-binding transcriptional LysR family regulator